MAASANAETTRLAEIHNYLRLQYLLNTTGNSFLRGLFRKGWKSLDGSEWQNTPGNGAKFIEGAGKSLYKGSKPIQKRNLKSGNIDTWDLPLLIDAIKAFGPPKAEADSAFLKLRQIRNQISHASILEIVEEHFASVWEEARQALMALGVPQKDLDEVKELKFQNEQAPAADGIDKPNQAEAERLKQKGNEMFKGGRFSEAVELYSDAILLPGIPTNDLAVLYSNRSVAFVKGGDFSSAKADAKGAVHLRPTWWRGYARLANAYQELGKYQAALKYHEIALGMQPVSAEVKDARDYCRHMIAKRAREEHLDPIAFDYTFEDAAAKSRSDVSAVEMEWAQKFMYSSGSPWGICGEAFNYLLGRGVPQNYEMAASLFAKAASKGVAEGMYNLALLTREGKGVQRNVHEAHQLLLRAAKQEPFREMFSGYGKMIPNIGVSEAQHSLGLSYSEGICVPVNYKRALQWYEKALDNGCSTSANNIALMYAEGEGVERSMEKAFLYWKVAAHKGVVRAMENMAHNYWNMGDLGAAQKWYTMAVKNGSVSLPLSESKFSMFNTRPLKDFDCENFKEDLKEELMEGPLKHLVVPKDTDMESIIKNLQRASRKEDPMSSAYRQAVVSNHRKEIKEMTKRGEKPAYQKNPAKLRPKPVFDLVGLKPITLKEMDQTKDHIYDGFVLKLTMIEDALLGRPSIGLIAQDANGDVQRVFVYDFPQNKETQDVLGFGCRISVVNPYFRMAIDHRPAIRVDDATLLFPHPALTDKSQCRRCGKGKGAVMCRKCRRAFYCSKDCLRADAEMQHELVCIKRL